MQVGTGVETVEERYRLALDIARKQGAKSFEVRSATDLARVLRDQGKHHGCPRSTPTYL